MLEAVLDVTPSPWLGKCVITPVNCDKCVMVQAGSVTSRRGEWQEGLSCPCPAHVLGVALRMFSGACRECSLSWRGLGDHRSCGCGTFREAFLFSSCLAGKEREEENSSYPWDVEIGRNR